MTTIFLAIQTDDDHRNYIRGCFADCEVALAYCAWLAVDEIAERYAAHEHYVSRGIADKMVYPPNRVEELREYRGFENADWEDRPIIGFEPVCDAEEGVVPAGSRYAISSRNLY